ncbi:MAG TPA: HDIG domain-containing protein [Methylomusa anaerophila]|uniref:HD domain protein n=1 Tax=Methylomusa anaerophila TaxID=1930071 RepID=A0A348AMQ4_9FIRM|nr:HDIG domain-containing metalloprotein [Methylomusa anaerophila]BBB92352.1 HD domain protein [Methylomusa anaerophila]HML90009.1 HDIG domain-containing protein [Methylomusa anaerophila]
MLNRVKQVVAALRAEINQDDRNFVACHLTEKEAALFWRMNLPDQRHSLNVAYSALELAQGNKSINSKVLLKAALLHDVGKVKGDVSTLDKIVTVILNKVVPEWTRAWGREGRGGRIANVRHAIYIYYHHPARGADMLAAQGVEGEVVYIVGKHHAAPAANDAPELRVLRTADNMH